MTGISIGGVEAMLCGIFLLLVHLEFRIGGWSERLSKCEADIKEIKGLLQKIQKGDRSGSNL
jgi:hypothetical protein